MSAQAPQNPFLIVGTDRPASDMRAVGQTRTGATSESADAIVGANGEFNAYSKKDQLQQLSATISAAVNGRIKREASVERRAKWNMLAEEIRSAHTSHNAANFGMLGEEVTNEIRTTIARTGFIRRFLQERELVAGEETKVYLRKNDVLAYSLETDGTTPRSHIKQREIYLRENYINANISIEEKEIARLRADILQEKLEDGLESVMVQEDRQFKIMADNSAAALNVPMFFSTLTPAVYQSLKNQVQSRGIPVTSAWIANNLWNDIITESTFVSWFDQVSKHELVLQGEIGVMAGVTIHTDAFIASQLRVLNAGEIYFFSDPATLGQLLIRKNLASEPINQNVLGIPSRGWFCSEIVAPCIANANGVAKGTKL